MSNSIYTQIVTHFDAYYVLDPTYFHVHISVFFYQMHFYVYIVIWQTTCRWIIIGKLLVAKLVRISPLRVESKCSWPMTVFKTYRHWPLHVHSLAATAGLSECIISNVLRTGLRGSDSQQGQHFFFYTGFRPALGQNQPPMQRVLGEGVTISLG
jgi:hypothetical protein